MSIIDRFIARTFLASYMILLGVGIGLYIVADLLVNLDEFIEDADLPPGAVLGTIADYYGSNIPLYFSQLAGPVMALAAAFTLAMMLRNNELTALAAAGVPLQRSAVPILLCSVVLVGLWVVNQEFVIPPLAHKIARSHDDVLGTSTDGVYCAWDANNAILTARRFNARDGVLEKLFIIEPNESGTPSYLVKADLATYDYERRIWRLDVGRRIVMDNRAQTSGLGGRIEPQEVIEHGFTLSPDDLVLRQGSQWASLLSLRQMNGLIHGGGFANLPTIVMSRHVRLTRPLLQWILLALAIPFFLSREPISVVAAGGRALLLCGLFFGATFLAHGMIRESSAALVAWMPILGFGPVAVLQMANAKT